MPAPSDPLHLDHGPTWRNSIALAPLTNRQSHDDGALSDDEIAWLTARAVGGFGLVMTAAAFVAPAGHVWKGNWVSPTMTTCLGCGGLRRTCARPVPAVPCNCTTEGAGPSGPSPEWRRNARGTTLLTMRWR